MAWEDVQRTIDAIKLSVESAESDSLSASDSLTRANAALLIADCDAAICKLQDIRDKAEHDMEPTQDSQDRDILSQVIAQADLTKDVKRDENGYVESVVYASATAGYRVTQTRLFTTLPSGAKAGAGSELTIESL